MFVPKIDDPTPQSAQEPMIDTNRAASVSTDIALIAMCIIAALVSFWDISFTFESAVTVGWMSIMLYVVTTTVYRSKYDGGIYKGRQRDEYKNARKAFDTMRAFIMENSLTDTLSEWCNSYRAKDVEQIRMAIICPHMSYSEYIEKYKNISKEKVNSLDLSKQMKKAINQANSVKPLELSSAMLMESSQSRGLFGVRRALPMSGHTRRTVDLGVNYVSKFMVTFVCGMFAVNILSDPSMETFVLWCVRMFPVVLAFLTGEPGGERNVVNVEVRRITAQTQLLTVFFADKKIDPSVMVKRNEKNGLFGNGADSSSAGRDDRSEGVLREGQKDSKTQIC